MKGWRADVESHVEDWTTRLERMGRGWWPRYAYHFTDVQNAVSILNSGVLYARHQAVKLGLMVNDNADPEIIDQTAAEHLELVRFYFRPLTPTLYRNEGIRPTVRQKRGHCPVPVYLMFDLVEVVCRDDARFSRGTLASYRHGHSDRREYFLDMPWRDVYSHGAMPRSRIDELKKARHAEIVIPEQVRIEPLLRVIACRSPGERRTLLHGLTQEAREKWEARVRIGDEPIFNRKFPFIHNVTGTNGCIVRVELQKKVPYRLGAKFDFRPAGSASHHSAVTDIAAGMRVQSYDLGCSKGVHYPGGVLRLELEGCLAFHAPIVLSELPF